MRNMRLAFGCLMYTHHALIHKHTSTHTHTCTGTSTCTRTHTQTHTRKHTHVHVHPRTHMHWHAHMHTADELSNVLACLSQTLGTAEGSLQLQSSYLPKTH